MAKKQKRRSLALILRNYFITGVVVLLPIGFTLYLSKILIGISSKVIPQNLNPNNYLPFAIPGLEIIISIIFITIVGGLSLSFLGKKILKLIDDLFKRIPFLRTIYSAILQMTETFSKKDDDKKSVVLVEYPRKGVWAVGFATRENSKKRFKCSEILWTLQCTEKYSKKIIDLIKNNKNYYLKEISKEFENLIGFKVNDLKFKNIHGWRYAYNFKNNKLSPHWFNKKKLGICADWMTGPKAENAWLNANALFNEIKKNPPKRRV